MLLEPEEGSNSHRRGAQTVGGHGHPGGPYLLAVVQLQNRERTGINTPPSPFSLFPHFLAKTPIS